jgi:hypothetical protein
MSSYEVIQSPANTLVEPSTTTSFGPLVYAIWNQPDYETGGQASVSLAVRAVAAAKDLLGRT